MSWEGSWKEGECKRGVGSPWQRMLGELLSRGRRRAWRSGEVRLGKIAFVWDRCEDEDETRGCEWERERTKDQPEGEDEPLLAQGLRFCLVLFGGPSLERTSREARGWG